VQFFRAVVSGNEPDLECRKAPDLGVSNIPEKSLKGQAVSHQIKYGGPASDLLPSFLSLTLFRLGETKTINPVRAVTVAFPAGPNPFAIVNFKYRSRGMSLCLSNSDIPIFYRSRS